MGRHGSLLFIVISSMNVENDEGNTSHFPGGSNSSTTVLVLFPAQKGLLDHAPPAFCSAPDITDGVSDRLSF
jgi:hypothetical protein